MQLVRLILTRGTVIRSGENGETGQVVEVNSDTARDLLRAQAAKKIDTEKPEHARRKVKK